MLLRSIHHPRSIRDVECRAGQGLSQTFGQTLAQAAEAGGLLKPGEFFTLNYARVPYILQTLCKWRNTWLPVRAHWSPGCTTASKLFLRYFSLHLSANTESHRTEYVRIPLEAAKRVEFYNNADLASLVSAHLRDKEKCDKRFSH